MHAEFAYQPPCSALAARASEDGDGGSVALFGRASGMGVSVCAEFHRCGSAVLPRAGVKVYAWLPSPMAFERRLTSALGWFKMPPVLDGLNAGKGFGH